MSEEQIDELLEQVSFAEDRAERAEQALSSQSLSLSEARERGDEYERLYRQTHLDYVAAEYKLESAVVELSEAREEIERLKGLLHANGKPRFNEAMRRLEAAELALKPFAEFADVYDADHVRRSGGRPENYDLSDSGSVATGGRRDSETYRVLVVGDLRRAKSALESRKAGLADASTNSASPSLSSLRKGAEVVAWRIRPIGDQVWHLTDDPRPRLGYEMQPLALVSGSREDGE